MKQNKNSIKWGEKLIKSYLKIDYKFLILFISDILTTFLILIGFLVMIFQDHFSKTISTASNYITLSLCFYILIKFTFTNFFFSSSYFINIKLYEKELDIDGFKIQKKEVINWMPLWFLFLLIFINIFCTVVANYETDTELSDSKVLNACLKTVANILLIPSFAFILNKVAEVKKPLINNYTNLIKNQFINFNDLFQDIKIENNYEYISFKKLSICSKKGVFIIANNENYNDKIKLFNNDIIKIYTDLWNDYVKFLNENLNSPYRHKRYEIERKFDKIFTGFLEL